MFIRVNCCQCVSKVLGGNLNLNIQNFGRKRFDDAECRRKVVNGRKIASTINNKINIS